MDEHAEIHDIVHQLDHAQTIFANRMSNKESINIKYASSYFKTMTGSVSHQEEFDQSQVIDKESVQYQAMEYSDNNRSHVNGLSLERNRRMSGTVPIMEKIIAGNQIPYPQPFAIPAFEAKNEQLMIHSNQNICQHGLDILQQKEKDQKEQKQLKHSSHKLTPKLNNNNKFVTLQSSIFHKVFKTYYSPIQINLPQTLISQQEIYEVETIVPCVFKNTPNPNSQANFNNQSLIKNQKMDDEQNKDDFEHFAMTKSEVQQNNGDEILNNNETVTDILLQKIHQLSIKIKQFQKSKNYLHQIGKDTKMSYSQTKSIHLLGSVEKVSQNQQLFSTKSSSNTKVSKYQIQSNIYSLKFDTNYQSDIIHQINLLKHKINQFENKQQNVFGRNSQEFQKEKIDQTNQKQFKGRIIKIRGPSETSSPSVFTKYHEDFDYESIQSKIANIQKPHNKRQEIKMQNLRKNSVSVQKSRMNQQESLKQFKTQKLHLAEQDCLQLENYDQNLGSHQIQQVGSINFDDIQVPQLNLLSPESSLQDLVQIGKNAFQKFGCQIDHEKPFKVKKYRNCVYFKFENFNILWHFDGKVYFGGWKTLSNGEGQKNGEGIEFVPGKYKFKGNFKDGKRCGFGKLLASNGTVYVGQWSNGLKHGRGRLVEANDLEYEGDWKNGKKNGKGMILFKSIKQFEGTWKDNLKNGYGKECFRNGDYYEGFYENNKFHGEGTLIYYLGKYTWKSKANFHGQFQQGRRHGKGLWRSAEINYDEYEGNYFEDCKNGTGQYRWANGTIFNGTFKNDLKHGRGIITYSNGRTSKLNWVNGCVQKGNSLTSRCRSMKNSDGLNLNEDLNSKRSKQLSYRKQRKANKVKQENIEQVIDTKLKSKQKTHDSNDFQIRNVNNSKVYHEPKEPIYKSIKTSIRNFNHF